MKFTKTQIFIYKGILKLIDLNNCSEFEKRKVQIFFNYNSIDEYIDSEYCLLLEYDGVIYQASLWSKILDYWELQSLINKNNYNIIGGFNKLLNYFIQEFKPNKILYKLDYNYFDKHIFDELDIKPQFKQYIYDSWNYDKLISNESEKKIILKFIMLVIIFMNLITLKNKFNKL